MTRAVWMTTLRVAMDHKLASGPWDALKLSWSDVGAGMGASATKNDAGHQKSEKQRKNRRIDGVRVLLYCAQTRRLRHGSPTNVLQEAELAAVMSHLSASYDQEFGSGQAKSAFSSLVSRTVHLWAPRLREISRQVAIRKETYMGNDHGAQRYKHLPSLGRQVEWLAKHMQRPHVDTDALGWVLPLVFPMVDDYEKEWQLAGLALLSSLLHATNPTAFRFHEGIIFEVLGRALNSRHEGVAGCVVRCMVLGLQMSAGAQAGVLALHRPRVVAPYLQPRVRQVMKMLIRDVVRSAAADRTRRDDLLIEIVPLVAVCGIHFVRFLPQLLPWLLEIMGGGALAFAHPGERPPPPGAAAEYAERMRSRAAKAVDSGDSAEEKEAPAAIELLLAIMVECWPRMRHHKALIMVAACRAAMVDLDSVPFAARVVALLQKLITTRRPSRREEQDSTAPAAAEEEADPKGDGDEGAAPYASAGPSPAAGDTWVQRRFDFLIKQVEGTPTGALLIFRLEALRMAASLCDVKNVVDGVHKRMTARGGGQSWFVPSLSD